MRGSDARLAVENEPEDHQQPGGGLEQARHPGNDIDKTVAPVLVTHDPLGLADGNPDPAADKSAMDQARALATARASYAIDAGLLPAQDMLPGI